MNLDNVISELRSIKSYRTRYFTLVTFSSDYYNICLSLLFIDSILYVDNVLMVFLDNGLQYELLVDGSTRISYVTDEPLSEEDKRRNKLKRV